MDLSIRKRKAPADDGELAMENPSKKIKGSTELLQEV